MTRAFLLLLLGACAAGSETGASTTSAVTGAVPVANVTMLAPLSTAMLTAATVVGNGKLLPDAARAAVGQLVEHVTAGDSDAALRVVCTRIVPCEKALLHDANADDTCAAQVRFVLQPVHADTGADDAAVHVFYELPAAAKPALARSLAAGPVDAAATAALGTLARVTFVRNVDVKGNGWVFGGFDATLAPLTIPRIAATEQRIVTNGDFPFAISLSPKPPIDAGPQLGLLLDPVRLGILFDADPDRAKALVLAGDDAARALEDPRQHDTADTDCASCHVAGAARNVAAVNAAAHGFALAAAAPAAFGATPAEALRACGYAGTAAVMSARLVNETSLAAAKWAEIAATNP